MMYKKKIPTTKTHFFVVGIFFPSSVVNSIFTLRQEGIQHIQGTTEDWSAHIGAFISATAPAQDRYVEVEIDYASASKLWIF